MHVLILGAAAGGGFPQWNCHCPNCKGLREGKIKAKGRTQSSIAVSSDGKNWVLINASPDLREQINSHPQLWPDAHVSRGTRISAIVLTDSQIDHTTGLLTLREGLPLPVYCTDVVAEDLTTSFPLFTVLKHWHGGLQQHSINTDYHQRFVPKGAEGLTFQPVVLESNAPPYSTYRDNIVPGNNIGLKITDDTTGNVLFYAPGCMQANDTVKQVMRESHCVLFDGTLWANEEMIDHGFSNKLGTDMGHMPVNGKGGAIALLNEFNVKRKVLIHINNTNRVLDEDSSAYHSLCEQGIELAYDGMEIEV
ncbi:pyrroloquinoline quinone biosynthesis protein PqqB [Alteromonas macleodii]|jgi:pyrroloquinoline quinone biosynthesis protein B|uniref:pyrroloquinoline quinone biosynthesis protein PqqB n=1 Tax=Alteromonas TaxID=226 RepID=UPI00057C9654|nr:MULTISPECIES: pyrroloquinoline quinone biosynthesis protein PqqB [Alteromonas]MCP4281479.1 pyrroloquinoline quinone biosynthesis protein PqqB [Alteromonas sp.]MEC7134473.1 pyrroloquinoline quinone biosynthesis protein PqqB [Pseudomonadota bacterium]KHT55119.1 pyrroloquinoline quinone biosynthesis protein PqqB [Alteromonas macleodii]MCG7652815.1 pyrroloquinoline quinone biosynthesis protein PqqB [Alteromonas sp. Cnat2-8]MDK2765249.1 pyrroloquinoline quinone biosynthesis protein PqqB [Alterom|tara:strand:- start:893 stop:1813 length:921 start_codon:yes stop_codon:yes gene_type:complete